MHAGSRLSCAVDESLPNSGGEEEEAEAGALGHQKSGLSHMADYVMDDDDYVAATKTNRARQRVNVRRSAPGGGRGRGGRRRRDPDDDEAEEGTGRKRRKRGEGLPGVQLWLADSCMAGGGTRRRHALIMKQNHEARLSDGVEGAHAAAACHELMGIQAHAAGSLHCSMASSEFPFLPAAIHPCSSMRQ